MKTLKKISPFWDVDQIELNLTKRMAADKKISEGAWDANTAWEFYVSDHLPPRELCSAAFCLGVYQQQIILTQTNRVWELLGGHIESGETIEQALVRESYEEGGIRLKRFKLFGYRKIIARNPVCRAQGKGCYPFPISYIPHYVGIADAEPEKFTGKDVLASQMFPIEDLSKVPTTHGKIIQAGLEQLPYME